jgi:superfamily II DNA helicase RecQ
VARDQDLIVVLPTGAGKSLTFQLSCQIEAGCTTVLVVPLKVLIWQFGNPGALPFSVQVFDPHHPPVSPPQLLVLSIETTQHPELHKYLHHLYSKVRLARIVFDECHSLEIQKNFRPIMLHLPELRGVKIFVPFIFLSATLTPSRETQLKEYFGCPNTRTIRTSCNRPNISYTVTVTPTEADIPKKVAGLVSQLQITDKADRGIIFCPTTYLVDDIMAYLTTILGKICLPYTGKMTDPQKADAYKG